MEDHYEPVEYVNPESFDLMKTQFSKESAISVKLERKQFPLGFDQVRDQCLAIVSGDQWVCINRALSPSESPSNITYPLYQTGQYSVIFNP